MTIPIMSPMRQAKVRLAVNEHAAKMTNDKFRNSQIVSEKEMERLPQFSIDEIVKGRFLGKGFFGMVYEIQGFKNDTPMFDGMSPPSQGRREQALKGRQRREAKGGRWSVLTCMKKKPSTFYNDFDSTPLSHQEAMVNTSGDYDAKDDERKMAAVPADRRAFMKVHCLRDNGQTRYAIKQLRPEILKDPTKLYYQGIMDLNSETRLLSSVEHPNIVKIRAIAKGKSTFDEQFFIVLDRLYQVLENRLKDWQRSHKRISGFTGRRLWDRNGEKRGLLWEERIVAAYDMASALEYLHSKRIIHRDLKNDNVGFDIRGDIKMFDFGLARELPPQEEANKDGAWNMTGSTGTPRMMASEVALDQPYNASCDTYSFCMLLWEILALKTPYELYTPKLFKEKVWRPPYKRPLVDPTWPKSIHLLLHRGWSGDFKERHSMASVAEILRKEVVACRDGNDRGLDHLERRSTFVFDDEEVKSHHSFMSRMSSPLRKKSPFHLSGKPSLGLIGLKAKDKALDGTQETVVSLTPSRLDFSGKHISFSPDPHSPSRRHRDTGFPAMPALIDDHEEDAVQTRDSSPTIEVTPNVISSCLSNSGVARSHNVDGSEALAASDGHPCTDAPEEGKWNSSPAFSQAEGSSHLWDLLSEEKIRRERLRCRLSRIQESIATID